MTLADEVKQIQDTHIGWTFVQAWNWLRRNRPKLFNDDDDSQPPAVAVDNVPREKNAHPSGTDSPDPRAKPFKNYDQRDSDDRIVARAELQQVLKAEVAELRRANPKLTFRKAWNVIRANRPELFEEDIVEAADAARPWTERILTAEAPMLARYGLTPDDVPEPYRSDSWYH